jgi:hypothetical protein
VHPTSKDIHARKETNFKARTGTPYASVESGQRLREIEGSNLWLLPRRRSYAFRSVFAIQADLQESTRGA